MALEQLPPAQPRCQVCSDPQSVTAILIRRHVLYACLACAHALVQGEFIYRPHPKLPAPRAGDGPCAYPTRALNG